MERLTFGFGLRISRLFFSSCKNTTFFSSYPRVNAKPGLLLMPYFPAAKCRLTESKKFRGVQALFGREGGGGGYSRHFRIGECREGF